MMGWKRFWSRVSRPVRIVLNLLLVVVLAGAIYICLGSPSFTPQQAYYREASRNGVGGGEIICILETDACMGYDHLVVAETEHGCALYGVDSDDLGLFAGRAAYRHGAFSYCGKGAGVTVMPASARGFLSKEEHIELPVAVFHSVPGAVRAELDLHLVDHVMYGEMACHYSLKAQKKWDGCFVFELKTDPDLDPQPLESIAVSILSQTFAEWNKTEGSDFTADVRLYDRGDTLIYEETVALRSPAGEAHAARGEG